MSSVDALKRTLVFVAAALLITSPIFAQEPGARNVPPTSPDGEEKPDEQAAPEEEAYAPALPEGMTLDEVLDYAAKSPPETFPRPIPDDRVYAFLLGEQLEYRLDGGPGELAWEFQAWVGGDFDKLWIKTEGETAFVDEEELGSENDVLYSRLITPFWNAQIGAQYANGWMPGEYEDRWSAAVALQGMAPGSFEIDISLYLSEDLDLTAEFTMEYDLRITQRLVLQPHTELAFSVRDVPRRQLGAGLTSVDLDLRLRYEFARGFAPYVGGRYHLLTFGTAEDARSAGEETSAFIFLAGLRFAI